MMLLFQILHALFADLQMYLPENFGNKVMLSRDISTISVGFAVRQTRRNHCTP